MAYTDEDRRRLTGALVELADLSSQIDSFRGLAKGDEVILRSDLPLTNQKFAFEDWWNIRNACSKAIDLINALKEDSGATPLNPPSRNIQENPTLQRNPRSIGGLSGL